MGRGERWRAMSGRVMDAHHCITKCSNILFYRPIPVDAVGYHRAIFFLSCLQMCRSLQSLGANLIFFNF